MAPTADPYRTLGLSRSASLDEVKKAYRRLAKANHPDAAGETALPRFLAIQAAYDQIVGPDGAGGGARPAAGPTRPWQADDDRANATHRAYGGRARRTRTSRTGAPPRAGGTAGTGTSDTGAAGSDGGPDAGRDPGRAGRPPKKATLGSTSYDGADGEPFEPDWGGASWYGTTSGTYWTLNPKEYADPRKHGPEYQARARRAAEQAATTPPGAVPPVADPTHTTGTWWRATDTGTDAPPPPPDPATEPDAPGPMADDAPPDAAEPGGPGPASAASTGTAAAGTASAGTAAAGTVAAAATDGRLEADLDHWLDPATGGLVGRAGRAVVGWMPIALGLGWLLGEITGCGRFAATCDPSVGPMTLVAQLAVLIVLLLIPRLAAATVVATIATLVVAVPGALVLSAMGGAADAASSRAALAALLVVGWMIGLGIGLGREVRRPGADSRPVS